MVKCCVHFPLESRCHMSARPSNNLERFKKNTQYTSKTKCIRINLEPFLERILTQKCQTPLPFFGIDQVLFRK